MREQEIPVMATVEELRQIIGPERMGRSVAYQIAHKYGKRLGKRYLIPRDVVLAVLEGRLSLEDEKTAR